MLSSQSDEARNSTQFQQRVLHAVAAQTQKAIADRLGWDSSKMSRVLSGEHTLTLEAMLALLAACDLAVIDAEAGATVTISREHYLSLVTLASERMDGLRVQGVRRG